MANSDISSVSMLGKEASHHCQKMLQGPLMEGNLDTLIYHYNTKAALSFARNKYLLSIPLGKIQSFLSSYLLHKAKMLFLVNRKKKIENS